MSKYFIGLLVLISVSAFGSYTPDTVRSKGSKNADIQSVYFGSGATCSTQCTTGTCAICIQVGSKITSVSFLSAGSYQINGIDGTKYTCTGNGLTSAGGGTAVPLRQIKASSTSSYVLMQRVSSGTGENVGDASILCFGKP